MSRTAFVVAVAAVAWGGPARAATIPIFADAPSEYTPGTPFTFTLLAPDLVQFSGFEIDLVFSDTVFAPTAVSGGGLYPFSDADFHFDPGADDYQFVVSDLAARSGVSTSPDPITGVARDVLAIVTVTPPADYTDDIIVSIGSSPMQILRNEEFTPSIEPPPDLIISKGSGTVSTPVPAPAAWVSLGLGGALLAGFRRRFARPAV